jgi:hypothetical protein
MKRYHWTVGIGPRIVSMGAEDEKQAAIDAVKAQMRALLEQDMPGLWARVADVTKPFMWANPPSLGWEGVFEYRDPRPPVDDPETQELKRHLHEAHNMIEAREGGIVKDEVVYDGTIPDIVVGFHDWVHREQRFGTPDHTH